MAKKVQKYYEAVGRRKTAVARVRLIEDADKAGISINNMSCDAYLQTQEFISIVTAPLRATAMEKNLKVDVHSNGGGKRGQAEAIQMGIARALVVINGEFQRTLRDLDYLKRDPRKKERKKPGLKKARRAPQWAKR